MATLADMGLVAAINILTAFIFLVAFAILRLQPFNDRFVNLDFKSYLRFLNWMPETLKMHELELKIFVPMTFIAWAILVPVNWTNDTLQRQNVTYSEIDKLSISNIPLGSHKVTVGSIVPYFFHAARPSHTNYATIANILKPDKKLPSI
ncbi:Calcium permeable stress-gated cation channel 1 [Camellia lanceoleosa]|nr:Calcium permeable stress-gated cation channel 1 [Camellia lanceoleosa]